jgi:4-hydroxy-tetrahydrodipicolinate reductase
VATSGIPVVLMGLGEIGQAIARAALARPDLEVVAAVDPSPSLAGRTLAEILGGGAPELRVARDLASLAVPKGGVVLHATRSLLAEALPEVQAAVRAGLHVVSTCEELADPSVDHEEEGAALDRLCDEHGVAVVATGVNPGFVLDRLPALLAHATGPVRHVLGVRVVELAGRRAALRRKMGVGLTEDAFQAAYDRGELGHVGLRQSASLVAQSCFDLDAYEVEEDDIVALVADEDRAGPVPVQRGEVAGVQQVARAYADGREIVRLELTLQVGAEEPRDELVLDAQPPLRVHVPGGVQGDLATAHVVVNAVHAVVERQGLITVLDLPAGR